MEVVNIKNNQSLIDVLDKLKEIEDDCYFKPQVMWPKQYSQMRAFQRAALHNLTMQIRRYWMSKKLIDIINDYAECLNDAINDYDGTSNVIPDMLKIMLETVEDVGCEFS